MIAATVSLEDLLGPGTLQKLLTSSVLKSTLLCPKIHVLLCVPCFPVQSCLYLSPSLMQLLMLP